VNCKYNIINNKLRKKCRKVREGLSFDGGTELEANYLLDGGGGPTFRALVSGGAADSDEIFASAARWRSSANRINQIMIFF
jgi:hypothetical protein